VTVAEVASVITASIALMAAVVAVSISIGAWRMASTAKSTAPRRLPIGDHNKPSGG
jgi:hypothetical protein